MKRRTSVNSKKHGAWLADFHFQENVSLFINFMNIANIGTAHTQLRKTELQKFGIEKFCAK